MGGCASAEDVVEKANGLRTVMDLGERGTFAGNKECLFFA